MTADEANQLDLTNKNNRMLLLGVTGSIATGKSTVAKMLEELGAPIIDFDILAREVVEPHKMAWIDIVDFFGRQILNEDQTINRKVLSRIVFKEPEKRKMLESFTHPWIQKRFLLQLDQITDKDPSAIVQAVVPLLFEVKMQHLFHKVLVVYVPQEIQIKRLMERDRISEAEALKILKSQISIDEKVKYADYVIHNDKSLIETRQQVDKLWEVLNSERNA